MDTILPVHPVEAGMEDVYGVRLSGASWEGALKLTDDVGESDLVNLGEMLMLTKQKPTPLTFRIGTMKMLVVECQ